MQLRLLMKETKGSTSVPGSLQEDLGQRLTGDCTGDCRNISQGEHDDDQKGETKGSAAFVSTCGCPSNHGTDFSITP
jgi:hypothetical protein